MPRQKRGRCRNQQSATFDWAFRHRRHQQRRQQSTTRWKRSPLQHTVLHRYCYCCSTSNNWRSKRSERPAVLDRISTPPARVTLLAIYQNMADFANVVVPTTLLPPSYLCQVVRVGEFLSNAGQGTLVAREVVRQARLSVLQIVLKRSTEYTKHTQSHQRSLRPKKCISNAYRRTRASRARVLLRGIPYVSPATLVYIVPCCSLKLHAHQPRRNPISI